MSLLPRFVKLLSRSAWRQLLLVGLWLTLAGIAEFAAIVCISRFMGGVMQAESQGGAVSLGWLGRHSVSWAAWITVCLFALSNALLAASGALVARATWRIEAELSTRVFQAVLRMPYRSFLERNSSSFLQEIWCTQLCFSFVRGGLLTWGRIVTCCVLCLALLLADWKLALLAGGAVMLVSVAIQAYLQGPLSRRSLRHRESQGERQRLTQESLNAFKALRLQGEMPGLVAQFRSVSVQSAIHSGSSEASIDVPRYVLESAALAAMVLVYLFKFQLGHGQAIAILSLYGIAGYRMLPAFHFVTRYFSSLHFQAASLAAIEELLSLGESSQLNPPPLVGGLRLQAVGVRLGDHGHPVLSEIDLDIARGRLVGLAGATGSGKSTLLDVLSGLLAPDEGRYLIDAEEVRLPAWGERLGYLPQQVDFLDDSIAANIALGLPPEQIDLTRLREVAGWAAAADFIEALPQGYSTRVGERGCYLSVGQRQRIGLARALYRNPELLILDEATSALDPATERQILQQMLSWKGHKTVLMSAHRSSALELCDEVVWLEAGRIRARGSFSELAQLDGFQSLLARQSEGEAKG